MTDETANDVAYTTISAQPWPTYPRPPEMPEHLKPIDARIKEIFADMTAEQIAVVRLAEKQAAANVWAMRSGDIEGASVRSWHATLQEEYDAGNFQ
jgi:hypothetical protein